MNQNISRLLALTAGLALASPLLLTAGGPLTFDIKGPFTWATAAAIKYKIDSGPLGSMTANKSQDMAHASLQRWATASGSLSFQREILTEDVKTSLRYKQLEDNNAFGSFMVMDNAGDIVAGLAGEANRNRILGWAEPMTAGRQIGRFASLMNGALASNAATVESTMVHEFGHALGLDHSQINASFANDGDTDNDQFLPTMYPMATDDDSSLIELNPDDVAQIRFLYPTPATKNTFGVITGRVVRGGKPVLGANVVASRQADTGGGASTGAPLNRFSCVSDFLMTKDGMFQIPVIPGKYKLHVEKVLPDFTGGSSVGPYAEKPSSPSFSEAIKKNLVHPAVITVTGGATVDAGTLVVQP
jgi:hypothetical protein